MLGGGSRGGRNRVPHTRVKPPSRSPKVRFGSVNFACHSSDLISSRVRPAGDGGRRAASVRQPRACLCARSRRARRSVLRATQSEAKRPSNHRGQTIVERNRCCAHCGCTRGGDPRGQARAYSRRRCPLRREREKSVPTLAGCGKRPQPLRVTALSNTAQKWAVCAARWESPDVASYAPLRSPRG